MNFNYTKLALAVGLSLSSLAVIAAEYDDNQLETIVITAEKMTAESQKTPLSVSVLTDYEVERAGLENTFDIVKRTPNVSMIKAGNPSDASFLSMRGITPTMEGSQSVLFLIDGAMYQTFDTELLDVERIEVLRGPQGTLYGRNASSGVISIHTKDPDLFTEGSAGLTYGNYNQLKGTVISGGAIGNSDEWAYRTALQYSKNDGYFTRDYDNKDDVNKVKDFNGRLKVRWMPIDQPWDIIATVDAQNRRNGNMSFASLDDIKKDSHRVYSNFEGDAKADIYTSSIRATYAADNFDITSITAYTTEDKVDNQDLDFTQADGQELYIDSKISRVTQELRFSSSDDRDLRWVGGFYYFNETAKNNIDMNMKAFNMFNTTKTEMKVSNYALFGNVNYQFAEKWEAIAGLRFDYQKVKFNYTDLWNMGFPNTQGDDEANFNEWLPKVGLNYYATNDVMMYASISRGYKSGGFNMLTPPNMSPKFDPEYTMNYELGMKSEWFDNRVRFNSAVFWIDWEDQQVEQQLYPKSFTQNAGSTVSRGIEAELSWLIQPGLTAWVNGGYNDAHFTDFAAKSYDNTGNVIGETDYTGNRPANAPKYTYSLGMDYNFLENYFVYTDYNVTGDFYFDNANENKQDAYGILNLRTGYTSDRLDVTLWAKNVLDEKYLTRAFPMGDGANQKWYGRSGDPLTVGATVNLKW
ncbi:TonB-dependent receptor [Photobacterium sanguinicancri]|uniref:TonB-dependent receptor n=1 Tax=Photobacterium sanguinicancri TaxID=875932 RepID=UPI0026E1BB59|nr:TonB-dependent receptor [Photobacterium sanguinicancri]MDO6500433.1 TonB-dependent receptor [Photobacterium sanguinicancri]